MLQADSPRTSLTSDTKYSIASHPNIINKVISNSQHRPLQAKHP